MFLKILSTQYVLNFECPQKFDRSYFETCFHDKNINCNLFNYLQTLFPNTEYNIDTHFLAKKKAHATVSRYWVKELHVRVYKKV